MHVHLFVFNKMFHDIITFNIFFFGVHHDSWITTTCRISCLLLWLLMFYNNNYNNVLERTRHWLTSVYGTYLSLFTTCSTLAFIHLMPFKIFPPQRKSKSKLVKLINKLRASLKWIYSELCTHSSIYNSTGCFFSLNTNKRIGSTYDSQECFILLHVFFCVTKDQ